MKKLLLGGLLVLLLLGGGGAVAAALSVNSLARKGIEKSATYALGVPTTLKSAKLGLFSGELGLAELKVANPEGFPAPHFLALGGADVAVTLGSLLKDTIEVPKFSLDSLDVHLERKDRRSNYEVILDNLAKLSGEPKPDAPESEQAGAKKLVIRELSITNVTVHVDLLALPGAAVIGDATGASAETTIPIREIKLTDVGKTDSGVAGTGVTIGELTNIIVQAILASAVELGGDLIPADIKNQIIGRIADLGGLSNVDVEVAGKTLQSVAAIADSLGKDLGIEGLDKAVEGVAGEAGKVIQDLGGILGGKKKKD